MVQIKITCVHSFNFLLGDQKMRQQQIQSVPPPCVKGNQEFFSANDFTPAGGAA